MVSDAYTNTRLEIPGELINSYNKTHTDITWEMPETGALFLI